MIWLHHCNKKRCFQIFFTCSVIIISYDIWENKFLGSSGKIPFVFIFKYTKIWIFFLLLLEFEPAQDRNPTFLDPKKTVLPYSDSKTLSDRQTASFPEEATGLRDCSSTASDQVIIGIFKIHYFSRLYLRGCKGICLLCTY